MNKILVVEDDEMKLCKYMLIILNVILLFTGMYMEERQIRNMLFWESFLLA